MTVSELPDFPSINDFEFSDKAGAVVFNFLKWIYETYFIKGIKDVMIDSRCDGFLNVFYNRRLGLGFYFPLYVYNDKTFKIPELVEYPIAYNIQYMLRYYHRYFYNLDSSNGLVNLGVNYYSNLDKIIFVIKGTTYPSRRFRMTDSRFNFEAEGPLMFNYDIVSYIPYEDNGYSNGVRLAYRRIDFDHLFSIINTIKAQYFNNLIMRSPSQCELISHGEGG